MTEAPAPKTSRLAALRSALEQGSMRHGQRMINSMHPAEIASLIESLPPAKREIVWEFVDPELEGDVLIELNEEVRAELIGGMDAEELIAATEGMEVDDLADLIGDLPETLNERVLRSMDAQDRERLTAVLAFEEDSAGGLMNLDAVTVRPDVTLEVVLRYLRMRGELPERTDRLFVVNRHDKYLGGLDITRLLTEEPEKTVGEVMDSSLEGIAPETPAREVAKLFEDRDLVSAPVVTSDGKLLGRITIDDVVDVIREEADHSVMSMAGLDEDEDMFAGVRHQRATPRGLAGRQSRDGVPCRQRRRPVRSDHREGRRAGGADADRRQHGRHRRQSDAGAHHPRPGARPDRAEPMRAGCWCARSWSDC